MFNRSSGDVFGADALNLAAIIGAGFLLLASVTAPATYRPATQAAANPPIETVTVIARKSVS